MSTSAVSTPASLSLDTAAANASAQPSASPPSWSGRGTATRGALALRHPVTSRQPPRAARAVTEQRRQRVTAVRSRHRRDGLPARSSERAKTVTQSSDRQAGTTPVAGMTPRVGFTPTTPFSAAGTRPEPAVSVPRARSTRPSATATAEPELDPPDIRAGSQALRTAPCGLRVPTSPVANWSRLALPRTTAPAARSRATAVASSAAW